MCQQGGNIQYITRTLTTETYRAWYLLQKHHKKELIDDVNKLQYPLSLFQYGHNLWYNLHHKIEAEPNKYKPGHIYELL